MSDEQSRRNAERLGRPLTRRELRARERGGTAARAASSSETTDLDGPESSSSTTPDQQHHDSDDVAPLPIDQREYPELEPIDGAVTSASDTADEGGEYTEHLDEETAPTGTTTLPSEAIAAGYQTVGGNGTIQVDEAKLQQRRKRRRRRNIYMISALLAFVLVATGVAYSVRSLFDIGPPPDFEGPGGAEVAFTVNPGEGPIIIGNRLVEQDIVASTDAFLDAVDETDTERTIQPGEYTLQEEIPASNAAETLLRVGESGVHYAAVNSGTRITEVFELVADATEYSVEEIEEAAADPTAYGLPEEAPSLEGYIAVGEYRFDVDSTPEEILQQMIEPTLSEFERLGISDEEEQFRLVTIASILEAEARRDDFATVAGIIENRLNPDNTETGGKLQIDATVIYGLGVHSLQFTEEEREDESNEYNTYVHPGLPPGPIGAPSIAAIDAAAEPEENDYYYWITTNIETGETKFSESLSEHEQYQQEFRDYCDDNPEICQSE